MARAMQARMKNQREKKVERIEQCEEKIRP
jgi:hypothetical protein